MDLDRYLASLPSRRDRASPPRMTRPTAANALRTRVATPPVAANADSRANRNRAQAASSQNGSKKTQVNQDDLEQQVRALALGDKEQIEQLEQLEHDGRRDKAKKHASSMASTSNPIENTSDSSSIPSSHHGSHGDTGTTTSDAHSKPHAPCSAPRVTGDASNQPIPLFSMGDASNQPIPSFSFGDASNQPIPSFSFGDDACAAADAAENEQDSELTRPLHCGSCDKLIHGMAITAAGRRWHPGCFRCQHCHQDLEHIAFYAKDGAIYCALDYHELFTTRCHYCQTPIEDKSIFALNKYYHVGHLFCRECGKPFNENSTFIEHDGHPYCEKDYLAKFSQKCKGCDETITNEYLEALGTKWHPTCFVCVDCGKAFENNTFFVRNHLPYCEFHCHKLKRKV
ncbi:hypothetical protein BC940DRAFT_298273 [Gongronella butleri]|nr:hypothetical protein BC940DRAFT_298273 [Gongronella butleri]